eukprot:jgi/Chrzof1/5076/Cz15g10260.t1
MSSTIDARYIAAPRCLLRTPLLPNRAVVCLQLAAAPKVCDQLINQPVNHHQLTIVASKTWQINRRNRSGKMRLHMTHHSCAAQPPVVPRGTVHEQWAC